MNTEYRHAVTLWTALNRVLAAMPVWEMDTPELQARENLSYWIAQYRMGNATYIEWLFATQRALDVLGMAAPVDEPHDSFGQEAA